METDAFARLTRAFMGTHPRRMTRRGMTRLLGGLALGGPLALVGLAEAEAKCKKKCGPCKRCTKGKCKPKPAGTVCAGGTCQSGSCVSAAPPPPSPPSRQLAFACPAPPSSEGSHETGGNSRVAQTFTANRGGSLRLIEVAITKPPGTSGDYVVQLLTVQGNGVPSNGPAAVLAAVTIPDAGVPEGETTLSASFAGTALLANALYAAAVVRPESVGPADLTVRTRQGVACAGQLFAEGALFTAVPELDMIVSAFVA
jgi:hypothetical protein